jgi:hypothetical protein
MDMLRKSKLTYPPNMGLDIGTSFPYAHDWYGWGRNAASGDENSMLGSRFQSRILLRIGTPQESCAQYVLIDKKVLRYCSSRFNVEYPNELSKTIGGRADTTIFVFPAVMSISSVTTQAWS